MNWNTNFEMNKMKSKYNHPVKLRQLLIKQTPTEPEEWIKEGQRKGWNRKKGGHEKVQGKTDKRKESRKE